MDIGGLERVLINLINTMPNNFKHSIVCIEDSSDFSQLLNKQVDIIELKKTPGREFKTHWKILRLLFKNKPRVVQTYNLPTVEYQALAWLARVPIRIHAEHGREIDDMDGKNRKRNLLRKISLPFSTQIVSVSDDLTRWLIDVLKIKASKISNISNGIDTEMFCAKQTENNSFLIGAVGRIDEVKNHELLILLFEYLKEHYPAIYEKVTLEVVGDGPNLTKMKAIVSMKKLNNKIYFSGKSLNVVSKLRSFSLFLQPSHYEAMPMTVLEAMACQLPIIASDVGGVSKVIHHGVNGVLFQTNDLQELVMQVVELFENKSKRECLAFNAREDVVYHYSSQTMADNYMKLYRSVN